eukprot:2819663-Pyramimonas_sp.AAC.1
MQSYTAEGGREGPHDSGFRFVLGFYTKTLAAHAPRGLPPLVTAAHDGCVMYGNPTGCINTFADNFTERSRRRGHLRSEPSSTHHIPHHRQRSCLSYFYMLK